MALSFCVLPALLLCIISASNIQICSAPNASCDVEGQSRTFESIRSRNKKPTIRKVSIYGERNSCTTMISAILENNFRWQCDTYGKCVGPWNMWKHDFFRFAQNEMVNDSETLHIFVTRHP